jgi:hypothetical protein
MQSDVMCLPQLLRLLVVLLDATGDFFSNRGNEGDTLRADTYDRSCRLRRETVLFVTGGDRATPGVM